MPLSFPRFGHLLVGRALGLRRAPRRLVDNSARSEERGWELRADGASAPPKLSDIGASLCGSLSGRLFEAAETSEDRKQGPYTDEASAPQNQVAFDWEALRRRAE
jgi:hypothetical protein